jgi:disulfide bond formation protein DsbB
MPALPLRPVLALVALLVAGALAVALASEHWGGLVPCALCLLGRWPYWIALAVALPGLAVPRLAAWSVAGVGLAMLGSAAIGAVHVGVEAGWWPSPLPGCVARFTPGASLADQLASMPARPAKPCDEPAYLVPGLPVSMAAMNLVFSLAVAGAMGLALGRRVPR